MIFREIEGGTMKVKLKEYDIAELSLLAVKKRMQLYLNEILEKAIAA